MPILGTIASSTRQGLATNSFESIATLFGTGSTSSVTFTSIPNTYSHLQIRCNWVSTAINNPILRFGNGTIDTGANYAWTHFYGNGAGATALNNNAASSFIYWAFSNNNSNPNASIIQINHYASTSKTKVAKIFSGQNNISDGEIAHWTGIWNNSSSVIDTIRLEAVSGNFTTTSSFALYGIKG